MDRTGQAVTVREPISRQLLGLAQSISERAEAIANRTADKLEPVQMPECSKDNKECEKAIMQTWPSFFHEVRENLNKITISLNRIEDSVSRAEI